MRFLLPARKGPIATLDTPEISAEQPKRSRLRFAGAYIVVMPLLLVSCSSSSVPTSSLPTASSAPPAAAPAPAPSDDAFLAKAAAEPGAIKTASGLIYKDIKKGTGASPKATDTVNVNYRGTLTDGTEFDASAKHGGPAPLPLDHVIPCWTEGVQMMKVGGKAQLTCPGDLAYGPNPPPGSPIGPNATLVFEIELVSIAK